MSNLKAIHTLSLALLWVLGCSHGVMVFAAKPAPATPPLRSEISLNGDWAEGGAVPKYFGEQAATKTYRRDVAVPAAWQGKIIRVEFNQVNFTASVYANDTLLTNHVGGWIPFAVDVTPFAQPGGSFSLRVEVKSARQIPYVDAEGKPLWPVGTYNLDDSYMGIVDDVWLRAYGVVCVEDAFIKTSVRNRTLTVDYTVRNLDTQPRRVYLTGRAAPANGGRAAITIKSAPVMLAPGEARPVTVSAPWNKPALWTPESPNLYHLTSQVRERRTTLDEETRRFGFREIWIAGNQYFLNGVRLNLIGDSIPRSWCPQTFVVPAAWPATVDMLMKDLNLRVIRWHQFPAAEYLLNVADEKGLLLIDESALYARPWHMANQPTVIDHMNRDWIPAWIRGHRNHPSIVLWSAENEDWKHVGGYTPEQLQSLSETIQRHDPTRPVIHDGDEDLAGLAKTWNWHYPEGYEKLPRGSIYSWAAKVKPDKPTGDGEFFACPWVESIKPDVFWWQGTWVRGMRHVDFTDIRPFVMHWAWSGSENGARDNLKNSFAKVAVFDKDYDDLGIAPIKDAAYPSLEAGANVTRTLVLYNDEFKDTGVTVEVHVKSGDSLLASGRKTVQLELGHHREIPVTFQVPPVASGILEVMLSTKKGGVTRFTEVRKFRVTPAAFAGSTSRTLTFGEPR